MSPQDLENFLHRKIPLSQLMQVKVISSDSKETALMCNLKANHNHMDTAFGGSLSSLMMLTSYSHIFQYIDDAGHAVLKSAELNFKYPVEEDLHAIARIPDAKSLEDFIEAYKRKGKARIHIESHVVLSDGRIACTMKAEFVAIRSISH